MILTVAERISTLSILPKEGNYATMKILNQLRMSLSFTEDELIEWGITTNQEKGTVSWDFIGEAEIPIGEKATGIIVDELRKLDKHNNLIEQLIPIYEKFIPTTE